MMTGGERDFTHMSSSGRPPPQELPPTPCPPHLLDHNAPTPPVEGAAVSIPPPGSVPPPSLRKTPPASVDESGGGGSGGDGSSKSNASSHVFRTQSSSLEMHKFLPPLFKDFPISCPHVHESKLRPYDILKEPKLNSLDELKESSQSSHAILRDSSLNSLDTMKESSPITFKDSSLNSLDALRDTLLNSIEVMRKSSLDFSRDSSISSLIGKDSSLSSIDTAMKEYESEGVDSAFEEDLSDYCLSRVGLVRQNSCLVSVPEDESLSRRSSLLDDDLRECLSRKESREFFRSPLSRRGSGIDEFEVHYEPLGRRDSLLEAVLAAKKSGWRGLVRTDSTDSAASLASATSTASEGPYCPCDDCLLGLTDLLAARAHPAPPKKVTIHKQ